MSKLIKPVNYQAAMDKMQTEKGIKLIKDFFQQNLATELRLRRVTAPLFVLTGLGINDDLNGVERAVSFPIKDLNETRAEVVHSLAKWKRLTLGEFNIEPGYGIYTDMNAIRADEELDSQRLFLASHLLDSHGGREIIILIAYGRNVLSRDGYVVVLRSRLEANEVVDRREFALETQEVVACGRGCEALSAFRLVLSGQCPATVCSITA